MKYHVMNYDTAAKLDGIPSAELVSASADAPSGAVLAYRDKAGVWQHVRDDEGERYRRHLHEDVITVLQFIRRTQVIRALSIGLAVLALTACTSKAPLAPTPPPAPVAPACQLNNTATIAFSNRSANSTYSVTWNGTNRTTLGPGQTSTAYTEAAGVQHTAQFRYSNTNLLACNTATPNFAQCSTNTLSCTF